MSRVKEVIEAAQRTADLEVAQFQCGELYHSLASLQTALNSAKEGGASRRTTDRIRASISSMKGAIRNAENRRTRLGG